MKTGLIAQDRKFEFFIQTQSLMNALSNFTVIVSQGKAVCFCWLLFSSIVLSRTSGLGSGWSPGQSGDGCVWLYSSMVLDNDLCCKFPFILDSFEPEWPITWPNSSQNVPFQFLNSISHLPAPTSHPFWSSPDTANLSLKTLKWRET